MSFHSKYELVPLGEVARFINGDRSTNYPKGDDYVDNGTPFISATELREGSIDYSGVRRISRSAFERLRSGKIQRDDVLFCLRGSIGKIAYVKDGEAGAIASSLVIVRATERIDSQYLFFGLSSKAGQQAALGLNNGAAQPNLSVGELQKIPLPLPSIPIQHRIAGILSAYDELIENSQRRIQILESMARALYREWFIHFRFPGHESVPRVSSRLGEIPQGWEVRKLGDMCTRMESGGTPKRSTAEYWAEGEIDWYKTGELWDGFLFEAQEKITALGQRESTARLFEPGTILMAIYGSPTVGRMGILTRHASCNQAALGLVADKRIISQTYLYFILYSLRDHFNVLAQGAAQQNISKEKVSGAMAVVPSRQVLNLFDSQAVPIFEQVRTLQHQTQNLRRTRDLLLPRLLSGQIDVEAMPA